MTRPLTHRVLAAAQPGANLSHAAAILITSVDNGRLLNSLPLASYSDHDAEIDWDHTRQHLDDLGFDDHDRAIIELADSLATGQPVNLGHTLDLCGPTNGHLILRALTLALGIRTHGGGR